MKWEFRYGRIFLGRDEEKYGKEGTGSIAYIPDYECGGPEGRTGRQCPFQPRIDHTIDLPLTGSEGRLLHVSIASYRDPLCPKTLYNLFTKSVHPDKLRVRVLQQNDPEVDVGCLEEYCRLMTLQNPNRTSEESTTTGSNACPYKEQIFIHPIHAKEAAGPTYARALLSQDIFEAYQSNTLKPQDHCMSIDSHMDFIHDWDTKMVQMWDLTNNEYAVLSTYVAATDQLDHPLKNDEVPLLCMVIFTSNVRNHATKAADSLTKPKLTNAIWGAGLSFSKCHAELKVPVDPHTPMIFDGEEFNRAARFWTYGYDIYTPHRVYVFHDYQKSQSNPVMHTWVQNTPSISFSEANKRLLTIIDVPGGETDPQKVIRLKQSRFGLGDRRSLDQLIQFSGIDLRNRRDTIDGKNRCGNLKWVPFVEHPKGVNYIPKFDQNTEDPLDLPYDSSSVWYEGKVVGNNAASVEESHSHGISSTEEKTSSLSVTNTQIKAKSKKIQRDDFVQSEHRKDILGVKAKFGELLQDKHVKLQHQMEEEIFRKNKLANPILSNAEAMHAVMEKRKARASVLRKQLHLVYSSQLNNASSHFLVDRSNAKPHEEGLQYLPVAIRFSVALSLIGLIVTITFAAWGGRMRGRRSKRNRGFLCPLEAAKVV